MKVSCLEANIIQLQLFAAKIQRLRITHLPRKSKPIVQTLKKIPFLRGIVALIQSSATGSKHLNFSSEQFEDKEQTKETKEPSKLSLWLGVAAIGVLSFLFGKLLFTIIPVFLAD